MSADMDLKTISSFITKSDLQEQLRESKENQEERYIQLKDELIDKIKNEFIDAIKDELIDAIKDELIDEMKNAVKDEVRVVMIDKNEMGISNNATDVTFSPSFENEDPLSLSNINNMQRQLTPRQQSYDRVGTESLSQRGDVFVSQRELSRTKPPQEYLSSLATPPIHVVDVTLGKYNCFTHYLPWYWIKVFSLAPNKYLYRKMSLANIYNIRHLNLYQISLLSEKNIFHAQIIASFDQSNS